MVANGHLQHLTKISRWLRFAAWVEHQPVLGWIFGSIGLLWMPLALGTVGFFLQDEKWRERYPELWWLAGGLLLGELAAGLVARGAKRHGQLGAGVVEVFALVNFLDWMHAQVFSKNGHTRITIMVPVRGREGTPVLRAFLRPSAFLPFKSRTELSIDCNTGRVEGAAGLCYQAGAPTRIRIPVDPAHDSGSLEEYARLCHMPVEKVRHLTRKARYYSALPIESRTGAHLGVLVVDHQMYDRIVDSEKKSDADRAEERTKLFVEWISLRLGAIPATIRERA